jgi:hypothetical protein
MCKWPMLQMIWHATEQAQLDIEGLSRYRFAQLPP